VSQVPAYARPKLGGHYGVVSLDCSERLERNLEIATPRPTFGLDTTGSGVLDLNPKTMAKYLNNCLLSDLMALCFSPALATLAWRIGLGLTVFAPITAIFSSANPTNPTREPQ